jgi:hypothetical protein
MVHSGILQGMMCGNSRTINRLKNDGLKVSAAWLQQSLPVNGPEKLFTPKNTAFRKSRGAHCGGTCRAVPHPPE